MKAPAAKLYAQSIELHFGPLSDASLQQNVARTNALISNNSWAYGNDNTYDIASSSYDAAVREFKTLTPDKGELSLHILNRPDRKKGRPLVVANVQPAPRPAPKRNKESLL
jgi:hypothetical protein